MEGDISAPFKGIEGKLDSGKNGQEIKKETVSNIINEEVNNEQKQTEEQTDQEQVKGTGQEQEERIDQDEDEGTDQDQEGRTGQEQERGVDQEEEEDKQEIEDEDDPGYVKTPPADPAAPLNLTDSQERLKPRFEFKPEQLAEIKQLWDLYQDYTPAYTDINGYITDTELVYMLKCLFLMTYTPEQLQELIAFCVRPLHPQGHITFDQFVKIATIRQRDFPIEEELRAALQVLDTDNEGMINREYLIEVLSKQGHKMHRNQLKNLIKEVDNRNDGTIGVEDVVGNMCIDLTSDDMFKPKEEDEEENPET